MFTATIRFYFCLAILILPMVQTGLAGQDPGEVQPGLFRESLASFEKGEFRLAYEGFTEMIQNRSGNPMCSYYAGRCLVELNENLDEAIELLYSASGKSVPGDVDLYLGMAYHRDYNFAEAIRYYSRFEMNAARQDVKASRVKQMISDCRSAREITASYNQYEVMNVTFIDLSDSAEFSQIRMKGGELCRKPPEYFSSGEDRAGLSSIMFVPVTPVRGDYIYYSGYNRAGRDGAQLFRVRRGPGRSWGDPEEIRTLNSGGDEILPYFDPIEDDLYYASNCDGGVGGFDLYRSHYDVERDEWSEPINLGFPVNSVMDEYLLLPGSDLGMLMFFSNREGTDSTVTVYRVHLVEPKKKADPNNPGMLKEIASLGGVASEILAELRSASGPGRGSLHASPGEVSPESVPPKREPAITKVTILSPGEASGSASAGGKAPYQEILAEALMHQAASDSLKDLATTARARVRESDDPNDRWVWQKQIMVWEKKSRDEEELADALYATMDQSSEPARPGPAVNVPETIEVDTVMGDLTVYRYRDPVPGIEGEPGTQPARKPPVTQAASGYMNRFDILGASPYSDSNPIPVDVALPGGVFYRVQLGAFATEVEPGAFQGISPVTAETVTDRGLIKYYAGKFTKYEDASAALARIRSRGYEDAFIVAWYNGSTISTQRAKQLE